MKKICIISLTLISMPLLANKESKDSEVSTSHESYEGDEYRAFQTPVNYNFGGFSLGTVSIEGSDIDSTLIRGGGEAMINENWVYNIYYSGSIIDETYFNEFANAISGGISYRIPVAEKLDFVVGGDLIYAWSEFEIYNYTVKDNDFGFAIVSSLRYGFSRNFEGKLGLAIDNIYDTTSTTFTGALTYYFNEHIGVGVSYSKASENVNVSALEGNLRFNF